MATICLTLDMDDPVATTRYVGQATDGWTQERRDALARDLAPLFAEGRVIEMQNDGDTITALIHPDLLAALDKHGLCGL